MDVVAPLKCI